MEMVTYGGGTILKTIIESVAIITSTVGFKALLGLAISAGSIFAFAGAIQEGRLEGMMQNWMIPVIIGPSLLLGPTTNLVIKDAITQKYYFVDNVPLGLALPARISSHIGSNITKLLENVMHTSDDRSYQATGMVFGAESRLELSDYAITDPIVASNMRDFVLNCVSYDLLLGHYNLKEFQRAKNLWELISSRTSVNRGIFYKTEQQSPKYCSCKQAAGKLEQSLGLLSNQLAKNEMGKNLPLAYKAVTNLSANAGELIKQQMVIHSVIDGVNHKTSSLGLGHNYAVGRAKLQQTANMEVLGVMAGQSIITTRAVFEALLITSFIFVALMLAIPMGYKMIMRWGQMLLWINLWPPFYVCLDFIMKLSAKHKAELLASSFGMNEPYLCLATSKGLVNIYRDIGAYAGWASIFVPVISYMVLKGGMESFVHIAGNMLSASQGAASAAATEAVTGNYSYANASMDTKSFNTQQQNQINTAASMSHDFIQENTGSQVHTNTARGDHVLNQQVSKLPISINASGALSEANEQGLSESYSNISNKVSSSIAAESQSDSSMSNTLESIASGYNVSGGDNYQISSSVSESAANILSHAKQWEEKYGLDQRQGVEFACQLNAAKGLHGTPGVGKLAGSMVDKLGVSGNSGATRSQMVSEFENFASNEQVKHDMSNLSSFAETGSYSASDSATKSLSQNLESKFNQAYTLQDSLSDQYNAATQFSNNRKYLESNAKQINEDYTQQFMNYLESNAEDPSTLIERAYLRGDAEASTELGNYKQQFLEQIKANPKLSGATLEDIEAGKNNIQSKTPEQKTKFDVDNLGDSNANRKAIDRGTKQLQAQGQIAKQNTQQSRRGSSQNINKQGIDLSDKQEDGRQHYNKQYDQNLVKSAVPWNTHKNKRNK